MGSDFGRGRPARGRRPPGGQLQTVFFAGALVVDWGGIYLTSREGNWRIHSAPHWAERYGLFIILAIGESVVAIGVGAAGQPISTPCSPRACSVSWRPYAYGGCTSTWSTVPRNA